MIVNGRWPRRVEAKLEIAWAEIIANQRGAVSVITNFEVSSHPSRRRFAERAVRRRRVIKTTLGELIVALTDEVMPFVREPSALYPVASWIFNDVLARHRLGVHKWSREKYPTCLAKVLH
jgi:hypothetical protein